MNNLDQNIKKILNNEISKPLSYEYTIKTAFYDKKSKHLYYSNVHLLKLLIVFVLTIGITGGFAFSKEIKIYLKNLFVNSTDSIDEATKNGYFQEVNMNYIYDKNIGIKVNNLVMDNLNLDISFNYKLDKTDAKSIGIKNCLIKNDKNKIIFDSKTKYSKVLEDVPLSYSYKYTNSAIKTSESTFTDSILIHLRDSSDISNTLYILVNSLKITYEDDSFEIIEGNWSFNIILDDKIKNSNPYYYIMSEKNDYVENCTGKLFDTGMIVEISLNSYFNMETYMDDCILNNDLDILKNPILLRSKSRTFEYPGANFDYSSSKTKIMLRYNNISKYMENFDTFELFLKPFDTTVILKKI